MSKVSASVEEVTLDHERAFAVHPETGERHRVALSVREHVEIMGGRWKFKLPHEDIDGHKFRVEIDLRPWRDRDLDNTYLLVGTAEQFTEEEAIRHNL